MCSMSKRPIIVFVRQSPSEVKDRRSFSICGDGPDPTPSRDEGAGRDDNWMEEDVEDEKVFDIRFKLEESEEQHSPGLDCVSSPVILTPPRHHSKSGQRPESGQGINSLTATTRAVDSPVVGGDEDSFVPQTNVFLDTEDRNAEEEQEQEQEGEEEEGEGEEETDPSGSGGHVLAPSMTSQLPSDLIQARLQHLRHLKMYPM
jgi:hypothetical protein